MDQFTITEKRNLVVLGRTGVGKSTVVNQILGKNVFPVSTLRRIRTSEEETEIETKDDEGKVAYKIKIIDTVGVQDEAAQRSKKIVDEVKDYLTRKAPEGVNLFLFVIRKRDFSEEKEKNFHEAIASFKKKVKKISALIITGCEGLDKKDRKQIVYETRNDQVTESLVNFMGKDVYPVGFPSVDNLRKEYEEGIKNDAEELRSVVLSSGIMTLPQEVIEEPKSLFQKWFTSN